MEFVIVRYPTTRIVFVDGSPEGDTNMMQRVDAGPHTFDLGAPVIYTPAEVQVDVQGTTFENPMAIDFQPLAVVPGMAAPAAEPAPAARRSTRKRAAARKRAKGAKKKAATKRSKAPQRRKASSHK